jgi:hypothetical protein
MAATPKLAVTRRPSPKSCSATRARSFSAKLLGDGHRLDEAGVPADQQELLAAPASEQVLAAYVAAHQLCKACQDPITGLMAAGVVDGLEMVDVDEHQAQRMAVLAPVGHSLLQRILQPFAVEDAGQRVGRRHLHELLAACLQMDQTHQQVEQRQPQPDAHDDEVPALGGQVLHVVLDLLEYEAIVPQRRLGARDDLKRDDVVELRAAQLRRDVKLLHPPVGDNEVTQVHLDHAALDGCGIDLDVVVLGGVLQLLGQAIGGAGIAQLNLQRAGRAAVVQPQPHAADLAEVHALDELRIKAHRNAAVGIAEAPAQRAQQLEAFRAGTPVDLGVAAVALVGHRVGVQGHTRRDDPHLLQQYIGEPDRRYAEQQQQQEAVLGTPLEPHAAIVRGIGGA